MRRIGESRRAAILFLMATAIGEIGASARADAINTWAGAGAEVQVFDRRSTVTGASAMQSARGFKPVYWIPDIAPELSFSVAGDAEAEASGRPEQLLRVDTWYSAPDNGAYYGRPDDTTVRASATWAEDSVRVAAPSGASLPESIRLHLTLNFDRDDPYQLFERLRFRLNGRTFHVYGYGELRYPQRLDFYQRPDTELGFRSI